MHPQIAMRSEAMRAAGIAGSGRCPIVRRIARFMLHKIAMIVTAAFAALGLLSSTLAGAQESRQNHVTLPAPFVMTVEATRLTLPPPFTMAVEAKRRQMPLPAPFVMSVEAKRVQLPAPFVMTVEARRRQLPAPFVMEVEAKRLPLPAPFVMTVEARHQQLPAPFVMEVEAKRQPLPAPFVMTVEAKRLQLPAPFVMTVEATKPAGCAPGETALNSAKELADSGQFAKARQTLDDIDTEPCPALIPPIAAERTRITDIEASKAEALLDACKFKDSRQLIQDLPEGPRRQALVDRWNKTYEGERKARDLIKEAVSLKKQGEYDRAIDKLHEASGISPCDKTATAIDKAIAAVASERDEGNRRCRAKFGTAALAGQHRDDGQFECKCQSGFIWNDTNSACIRRPPTVAEGHPVCRREFGPQAYAVAVNPNGTFKCQCSSGYAMKNKRCQRITIAEGHRKCRSEFGSGAYAVAINPNGTFKCQCRDGYRWTAGNKRCVRLTTAEGNAACRREFGPGSYATGYRGNGSWNCYIPPRIPPHIELPRPPAPPPHHQECPPGYNPYGCR